MGSKLQPSGCIRCQESTNRQARDLFGFRSLLKPAPGSFSSVIPGRRQMPRVAERQPAHDSVETQDNCRGILMIAAPAKGLIDPSHEIRLVPCIDVLVH